MENKFKTVTHQPIVNIFQHIIEKRFDRACKIHIGCDSIVTGGKVHYTLVTAFRYENSGAHFVFQKNIVPSFKKGDGKPDIFTRLWQEGRYTIEFANELVAKGIVIEDDLTLEFDYNDVLSTLSKPLIPAVVGWATGLGYKNILLKSDDQISVKAANQICQSC